MYISASALTTRPTPLSCWQEGHAAFRHRAPACHLLHQEWRFDGGLHPGHPGQAGPHQLGEGGWPGMSSSAFPSLCFFYSMVNMQIRLNILTHSRTRSSLHTGHRGHHRPHVGHFGERRREKAVHAERGRDLPHQRSAGERLATFVTFTLTVSHLPTHKASTRALGYPPWWRVRRR